MIEYRNECVGCPEDMSCIGQKCPKMNVPHYICDNCGEEEKLYQIDNKQLCRDCAVEEILESLELVK
mgnify:FL=1